MDIISPLLQSELHLSQLIGSLQSLCFILSPLVILYVLYIYENLVRSIKVTRFDLQND